LRHSRTQTLGKDIEIETEGMKIEEEIKERIAAGNRAFFTNKKIFQSKVTSKKSKIKL